MEGLTIRKKATPRARATFSPTSFADRAIGFLIFVVVLVAIPFLLVALLFVVLRDKFAPSKPVKPIEPRPVVWHEVPNNLFPLRYRYVMGEEISEGVTDYFGDEEPLILYQPDVSTDFFNGYFSDFKIECPTGIFVQRVNFDATLTEVESMPLCFFNYATQESEELLNLKGYNLYTLERPNHFTITATNQDDAEEFAAAEFQLEITLTDALYTPPDALTT
jgi:hypothetical protein